MSDQKIVLIFGIKSGDTRIEAQGFKGKTCTDATKFLKDALGESSELKMKSEYYDNNLEEIGVLNTQACG